MRSEDLPIGTIRRSSRHGHVAWVVEESPFQSVPSIYPGEKLPWTHFPAKCRFCALYNEGASKYKSDSACYCLECNGSKRKDGKQVYWRLVSIGRKKCEKPITREQFFERVIRTSPGFFLTDPQKIFDGNLPSVDPNKEGAYREITQEELEFMKKNGIDFITEMPVYED